MSERINISAPSIDKDAALKLIAEALESGQIAQGPGVVIGEKAVAAAFSAEHAALYANGTASLRGALVSAVAAKLGGSEYVDRHMSQKEVIIPAFSFNATLNTVLDSGATARVVDVREDDFCMDPDLAAAVINGDTTAIMPVDLYGQASLVTARDDRFSGLAIVRDAAQAHGAKMDGLALTEHGDAVSLSFYPTKNIAAPEGGAILTNDQEVDRIARIYRNQGMSAPYVYDMIGDNLRMTDIHAAILRANLGKLAYVTARRAENAVLLSEGLSSVDGIITPVTDDRREHVWHQYTVRVEQESFGMDRDQLREALDARGIGSGVYYPKIMTDHPVFQDHPRIHHEPTPVARKIASQVLSLPVHPGVNDTDAARIIEAIHEIGRKGK